MLILASTSPRRKELLKKITKSFTMVKPRVNERDYQFDPSCYALELSRLKAYEVSTRYPNEPILACDTIVIFNQEIINKPKDNEDAKRILRLLSNKTHLVISGYTYLYKNKEVNHQVITKVTFNKLSEELINEYVSKGYAKGKAGAYGIQDPFDLVKSIAGSYTNVMGLPIEDIKKYVRKE